jgi:hypothetical protein
MNAVLKSYGLPGSTSWYQCQAMLSVLLGTYPRVSSRIKADLPGWQAPWGPACIDLASWPLSELMQQPALELMGNMDIEPHCDVENPVQATTSCHSEVLHAAMATSGAPPTANVLDIDDGDDAFPQDDVMDREFLSNATIARFLKLDARRKHFGRGIIRSEVLSGNIQKFLKGDIF